VLLLQIRKPERAGCFLLEPGQILLKIGVERSFDSLFLEACLSFAGGCSAVVVQNLPVQRHVVLGRFRACEEAIVHEFELVFF
jgi:hypothetical protein